MTELRFHRTVYSAPAIEEALKVFNDFATFERADESDHWVIRVASPSAAKEKLIAAELGNYALGLTIRSRGR